VQRDLKTTDKKHVKTIDVGLMGLGSSIVN